MFLYLCRMFKRGYYSVRAGGFQTHLLTKSVLFAQDSWHCRLLYLEEGGSFVHLL